MMTQKIFFYVYIFCFCAAYLDGAFVQYILSQGRFGDQLLAYAKAQYVANMYDLQLLYTPFDYSFYIGLHYAQLPHATDYQHSLQEVMVDQNTVVNSLNSKTVYTVNLSTKHKDITSLDSLFLYSLENEQFKNSIKRMLTPAIKIHPISWPKDCITVALHVRKPSGHDTKLSSKQIYNVDDYKNIEPTLIEKIRTMPSDKRYPHKFPPDQYYIDQINRLEDLFPDKAIYVYLFTDYKDPEMLVELYKPYIKNKNIILKCHTKQQQAYMRFIDDYYNMAQTDCLIRPSSNFSRAAQFIGDHKVIIYPKQACWYKDAVVIKTICVLKIDNATKCFTINFYNTV
ncbi:hypothetical protein EKK58_06625 [Candidatus Dependentiae bacterium]|nr:MAG: hypothetical protein EKK58_06625 [Candidatus Dependentiae bacterium]